MRDVEAELLDYLRKSKPIAFGPESHLLSQGLLDSFEIHGFLVFLEETFHVTLTGEELSSESFDQVRAIAALVSSKMRRESTAK